MALNTNLTSTGGFPNAIAIYYDKRLLDRLEFDLHMDQFGEKKMLPKRSGNEIKWTRYTNFAANTTPLTEGTVPNGLTLASTQISATPVQYGDYVALSDFLITEAIDPVIEGAQDVLAYRAALSLDTIIRNTLSGNLTDQFAGGAANEAATSAVMTASELRKAVYSLKVIGAKQMGMEYQAVLHPAQSYDLQSDTAGGGWLDVNKYTSATPMLKGEVGKLYGVRVTESQNMEVGSGTGSGGVDIYHGFVFAKGCYGLVELAGHNLKTYVKQLGSSGVSDPLDQISTVGHKFSHVTKILDANRGIEIYAASNV